MVITIREVDQGVELQNFKYLPLIQAATGPFIVFGLFLFATALCVMLAFDGLLRSVNGPITARRLPDHPFASGADPVPQVPGRWN